MSRTTADASPSTRAARRQGAGRHRLGSATGVRCADIPAVRERMQFQRPAAAISAAAVIVTIPVVVLVLLFQRRIVAGLTAGAVKG